MLWLIRHAICDMYPATGELPGAADTGIKEFLREFKQDSPMTMWVGLVASTLLYVVTPLFTVGLPLPSFWLPRVLRELHAQRITSTPFYLLRMSMMMIKMPAGLCWGKDPRVREQFGLDAWPADPGTWRTE